MRIRGLLAVLISIIPAWPQSAPGSNQPEMSSQEAPFTFSSRVNLVSVPVVVRDRDGRAIGNLAKEDFQLYDKGKLQVITKFSLEKTEVETPAATSVSQRPAPPKGETPVLPEHFVAYLFDDIHLARKDLLPTRQAVNRHLDESRESSTRAAIFTTSGLVLSDFTDDREKLHKAVDRVQPWTNGPDARHDCPPMSYYMADILVNKLLYFDGYLYTDEQIASLLKGGQVDQALSAMVLETAACLNDNANVITRLRIAARQALTYGDRETAISLGAIRDIIRRLSAMPGTRNLVLVSPGFLLTRDHQADEYDVLDRAIRASVIVNTIDMRGLFANVPGGSADEPAYASTQAGYLAQTDMTAATQADDILGEMAAGTGGTFFHNDNRLKEGLNLLAARPEFVYVLGFSPENLKFDGSYHDLKVKLRNSGSLTMQTRRGYWAPRHAVQPAEVAKEQIQEAVFSRDEIQDIPIELQTEFFKSGETKADLTVLVRLHAQSLRFRKADERNNDTLTVVAGLFDSNGNFISGIQRVVEMHLRDQTLAAVESSGITLRETFQVAPGRYVVRLVVRDNEGQTMAARNGGVEIP